MNETNIIIKTYNPISQFDIVKDIWTSMLKKCPHNYFLSWAWIERWIKSLPHDCNLLLVTGFKNESSVISFFLGSKTTTHHKILEINRLSLNETLIPFIDLASYIEYNAILIDPEVTITLESLLGSLPIKWDVLQLNRCARNYQPNLLIDEKARQKYNLHITNLKSYYVNLAKVRSNNNDYLSLLNQNKRRIRQSIKKYEKIGAISIKIADNLDDALLIFDELILLHQKRWTERGYPGTFSTEYAISLHKSLISHRFKHREIQLMKVSAGEHTIGCLHSFIYNGDVLGFSGGFNYVLGRNYNPGFICHYFAILKNAKLGLKFYDFLEGNEDYKQSLSTDHNEMQHIQIEKRNMKYKLWKILSNMKRIYNKARDLIS